MATYLVNGETFTSKDQLGDAIRGVLDRYLPGQCLEQSDADFMFDVLMMHPKADEKIGCGIQEIGIRLNPFYKTKEFTITRTDSTSTEFSFRKCLSAPTHRGQVIAACRAAVAPGIMAFRESFFSQNSNPVCEITGEYLTNENAHVDHIPPHTFRYLWEGWITRNNINVDKVEVSTGGDNQSVMRLLDKALEYNWMEFHWRHARLRVISAHANLNLVKEVQEDLCFSMPVTLEMEERRQAIRDEMIGQGYQLMEQPL